MRFPLLRVALMSVVLVAPLSAQDLEQRVTELEQQVRELRRLSTLPNTTLSEHLRWGSPGGSCTSLDKQYYVTCHDGARRVPEWVSYHLTRESLQGNASRRDNFRADQELAAGERSELADYRGSGFDRGHMAPAAAFKRSRAAMSATFLLSNIAPQRPQLNRRIWRRLEAQVREVAREQGSVWVVTGSLYLDSDDPRRRIGDRVGVPTHFYKVIFAEPETGARAMYGFVIPNDSTTIAGEPREYMFTVDHIEGLAELDFFNLLPEAEERQLERARSSWPIQ